jgi:CDGSH-type Zn-finger protein
MTTKITVLGNGPLLVKGELEVVDGQGQPIATNGDTTYLCRCGASTKKPFCDGTHKKIDFKG